MNLGWPRTLSLHGRFVGLVTLVAGVLLVLAALVIHQFTQRHEERNSLAALQGVVSAVEKTAAIGAYAADAVLLQEIVDGLARHPLVGAIVVEGGKGQRLAGGRVPEAAMPPASALGADPLPPVDTRLTSPFDMHEQVGRLRVWVDRQSLTQRARQQAQALVVAMAVLVGVVLLVFNQLALRLLSRPMATLAHELETMTPGSYRPLTLAAGHERDEIGTVVRAANALLASQQRALAEVAAMEAQYRQIFDTTSAGIFVLSPEGRLINSNPAVGRLLGADESAMKSLREGHFPHTVFCDPTAWQELVMRASALGETLSADLEVRRFDGSARWVHCLVSVQAEQRPEDRGLVEGVLYDVTQRRRAESQALHRAEHDALTGLKNRNHVEAALAQRLRQAQGNGHSVALLFVDLDGFKAVNDAFGHDAGDAVLVESARRLRGLLRRSSDIAGRLGGDELVLVLDGADAEDPQVAELADRLVERLSMPVRLGDGREACVGASVGIASFPRDAADAACLLRAADAAMYTAKRGGKGRWRRAMAMPAPREVDHAQ